MNAGIKRRSRHSVPLLNATTPLHQEASVISAPRDLCKVIATEREPIEGIQVMC
jgi:hypothetical protein